MYEDLEITFNYWLQLSTLCWNRYRNHFCTQKKKINIIYVLKPRPYACSFWKAFFQWNSFSKEPWRKCKLIKVALRKYKRLQRDILINSSKRWKHAFSCDLNTNKHCNGKSIANVLKESTVKNLSFLNEVFLY